MIKNFFSSKSMFFLFNNTYSLGHEIHSKNLLALVLNNAFYVYPFTRICYRYVFSHYITYLVAFSGIYVKNFDPDVPHQVYALVLLGLVAAFSLAKIIIIIVRSIKSPIHYTPSSETGNSKQMKLNNFKE